MTLNNKFGLSLSDLQGLAAIASRNDTHHAFSSVALEWCVKANAKIDELQDALERERMRLVACEVVALENTRERAAKARDIQQDFRSHACDAVAAAVDREMQYREALEEIAALGPEKHSVEGCTERGEANLFLIAQDISRRALRWP